MYQLARLGCSMDRAAGTHHHHGGGWVCHGSWLATKKKMSGGLYNSTIKESFVHRAGLGERDGRVLSCYMTAVKVHPWDTGWDRNNCSEPNPRADQDVTWQNRCLEGVDQQPGVEIICMTSLGFLHLVASPEEELFPQLLIAYWSALRGLKDPLGRLHVCSWVCI